MIKNDRSAFVMGEIHFRFIGPAAYGDRVKTTIHLKKLGDMTLHWNCKAMNIATGIPIAEGRATRVFARINDDGTLTSQTIPADIAKALSNAVNLENLGNEELSLS
jgi:acyl-CoA thioesterase FadM